MPRLPVFGTQAPVPSIGRPDVLLARARRLALDGQPAAAIEIYRRVHQIDPTNVTLCNDLGTLFAAHGQWEDAAAWFGTSLRLDPEQPVAWTEQGIALGKLGRREEALAAAEHVIALRPDNPAGHLNRALALYELGRFEEAMIAFDTMIPAPSHAAMIANARGAAAQWCGLFDEALRDFNRAAALDPGLETAVLNKAMLLLMLGDLPNGFRLYDQCWRRALHVSSPVLSGRPWTGQTSLTGRTLLLYAEQGFGDTIQFSRYATMAAEAGARVILMVQPALVSVMKTLPGVARVVAAGNAVPDHDLHCSLLTLPLAFSTTIETIPAPRSYPRADPARVAAWRERLSGLTGYRIGLVWTGVAGIGDASVAARGERRSIPPAALAPLASVDDATFVSLQVGPGTPPVMPWLHDPTDALHDFGETAAAIETLDLVISVDTAVAHLAGALGKTVWLLNRFDTDWRWLLGRDDSPWYPSMRIFRQPAPGDWTAVIARVVSALRTRG